jgi:uncharacterized protein (TIGR03000 family)
MYSVVVLMAMTGGADLPACHRGGRHGGCCGCCGYQQSCGCCGNSSCNNGCQPAGCCGCQGGNGGDKGADKDADKDDADKESSLRLQPARIVVSTAANAKVLVDDYTMKSTAKVKAFRTLPLQPGEAYIYAVTAVYQQDGREVKVTRDVVVKAGQTARVSLEAPAEAAVAQR